MVLESTMICVDSSDYMRNGDFLPTRLQAQQDAVNLICHSKTRSNPENNVGLLTMSRVEVLVTLTSDVGHVLSRLHQVAPAGEIHFMSGIRVAHLALKHRQGKNHKMRIVVFVGSPIIEDEKELVKLAKRLKKEKVNVDVINFGEEGCNTDKLTGFVNTINGKEGTSSHLVTVPPGPILSDALVSSPIVVGEDGAGAVAGMGGSGFEFGVDPNEDPELALALRVSMEEQRARQEDEARKAAAASTAEMGTAAPSEDNTEETLLQQAIQMSQQPDEPTPAPTMPDFSSMTEEQQIAYALHMSMQADEKDGGESPMDVEESATEGAEAQDTKEEEEEDLAEVMNDPAFLQSVLEGLPGVDPRSAAIQQVVGSLTQKDDQSKNDDKKDDKKGDK